jgi:hypothetical protein
VCKSSLDTRTGKESRRLLRGGDWGGEEVQHVLVDFMTLVSIVIVNL